MIPCSSKNNFTIRWAILNFNYFNYYFNKNGLPDGVYARFLLRKFFFTDYENAIKYCKFILVDKPGIYHKENDSYSGGYGLVEQSKVDSFLRASDYHLEADKFYLTNCVTGAQFFALQLINKKTKANDDGLSYLFEFLIPSISFSLLLIVSLIFYFGFLFFALRTKLISKFALRCLSFLLVIFLFFIDNFINGNINTSNVIVDVSDLLKNLDDVLYTKKEMCLTMLNQPENDFFFRAKKGTTASKLSKKINNFDPCFIFDGGKIGSVFAKKFNDIFLLMYDLGLNRLTRAVRTAFKKDVFTSLEPIYENLNAFVISKKTRKQLRKIINTYVNNLFEFGYIIELFNNIPNYSSYQEVKDSEYRHYRNVEEYIDDNTKISAISFEKFSLLFKIYFGFLNLILFIFMIHFLIKCIKQLFK